MNRGSSMMGICRQTGCPPTTDMFLAMPQHKLGRRLRYRPADGLRSSKQRQKEHGKVANPEFSVQKRSRRI